MAIGDWVDVPTIRSICSHASGAAVSLLVFAALGTVASLAIQNARLRVIVLTIDAVVLVGILLWLAWQTAVLLWNNRIKINGLSILWV